MTTIDGMTKEQVEWNIYCFEKSIEKLSKKLSRARSPKIIEKLSTDLREATRLANNNRERLKKFEVIQ
jgi:hypothetical protein